MDGRVRRMLEEEEEMVGGNHCKDNQRNEWREKERERDRGKKEASKEFDFGIASVWIDWISVEALRLDLYEYFSECQREENNCVFYK